MKPYLLLALMVLLGGCGYEKQDVMPRVIFSLEGKDIKRLEKVSFFNDGLVHVWFKKDCIPSIGIKNGIPLVDRDGSCKQFGIKK